MSSAHALSPVSWQTLFWTLVPLATNIMTQPSGRVLSIAGRYRIYLRSSPIISCLDAVAFILRVLLTSLLLSVSLHESLKITIQERYKGYRETDEGLRSLEKQTWLRWLFFMAGTLGPMVKLMAMQGVPWTKAWGAMFLFAFLVIEVAALIARQSGALSVRTALPGIRHAQIAVQAPVAGGFNTIERTVFRIGAVAHFAILLWAFLDLWTLRDSAYDRDGTEKSDSRSSVLPLSSVMYTCIGFLIFIPYILLLLYRAEMRRDGPKVLIGIILGLNGVIVLIVIGIPCSCLRWLPIYLLGYSALFPFSLCCTLAFVWGIKKLCRWSSWLGETLLITTAEEPPRVDSGGVWALTLCINNVVVSVLWYWLRYDPKGTVNPGWTGVFG